MYRLRLVLILTVLFLAMICPRNGSGAETKSIRFKGRFLGFVEGDSRWAVFCVQGDSTLTAGVSAADVDLFCAAMAGSLLEIEAQVIDTYEENGVQYPIYGMVGASLNGYTARQWASETERVLGYDRAHKLFNALADSMVSENDAGLRCKH